ncbi:MAG: hypothetical protein PVF08_02760, partial [Gammaproteobacteria bacterium]
YFLLPGKAHALGVVNELAETSLRHEHLHTLARNPADLEGLPIATRRQYDDTGRRYWLGDDRIRPVTYKPFKAYR